MISISEYVFSHGVRPRGRGCWLFFFAGETDSLKAWAPPGGAMLYSQARRLAEAEAAARGTSRVSVAP